MEIDPNSLSLSTPADPPPAPSAQVTSRHAIVDGALGHRVWLMPTRAARGLATIGWMAGAVTNLVLLFALEPDFALGESHGYTIPLTDHAVFSGALVVSGLTTSLAWLWWTASAAWNARRLTRLGTSPFLPLVVYLGAPTLLVAGLDRSDDRVFFQWGAAGLLVIGHLAVLLSLRSTARRIGASTRNIDLLILFPLAWVSWRFASNTAVSVLSSSWRTEWLLFGLGAVSCLLLVGMAVATWQGTSDFDDACARYGHGPRDLHMPDSTVVAKAIRELYGQR
jgi:hypothetical protein